MFDRIMSNIWACHRNASWWCFDGAPPPRLQTGYRGGHGSCQSKAWIALVRGSGPEGEFLTNNTAIDGRHGHPAGHDLTQWHGGVPLVDAMCGAGTGGAALSDQPKALVTAEAQGAAQLGACQAVDGAIDGIVGRTAVSGRVTDAKAFMTGGVIKRPVKVDFVVGACYAQWVGIVSTQRYEERTLPGWTIEYLQLIKLAARLELFYGEGDVVAGLHFDNPGTGLEVGEAAPRRLAHDHPCGRCQKLIHWAGDIT